MSILIKYSYFSNMSSKQNNTKNSNLFESLQEGSTGKDVYKTTVKITTFSSKEEKWVQHSYEETHTSNRGRQLTSLKTSSAKTTCESVERLEKIENFSSIIEALRDDSSSENSQSEEDKQRLKEINEFLLNSSKKIKKMYQEDPSATLKYTSRFGPEKGDKQNSSNFAKSTDENLRNELEGILLQVYTEHINKSKEYDIKVFEKHITFCSESFNKKFNLYILQLLTEKISAVVERIKDKIYEINEVRLLKEKFYELKSNHESKPDYFEKAKMITSKMNKSVELNEKIKKAIREMLTELRENIYAVLESSYDIQKIFVPIVQHLTDECCYKFSFEEIHREEFANAVSKDEFLKIIFLQIKSNAKNPSYEELHEIFVEIEDLLNVTNKEMTRFKHFIELAIEKYNLNLSASTGLSNSPNESFHNHPHSIIHNAIHHHNCPCGHNLEKEINSEPKSTLQGISSIKKEKFKDLDELVDFINKGEEEEIKPKKNKRKNNKKEKKNQPNIVNNVIDQNKIEKEIEEFKINLKDNSINAFSIRKIKPAISREWLRNLNKEVIQN